MKFYKIILLLLFLQFSYLTAADTAKLIKQLGADHFKARKEAQDALIESGKKDKKVLDLCLNTYKESNDPEVKDRLHKVLFALTCHWIFDRPKAFLGIQFSQELEKINKQHAYRLTMVIDGTAAHKAGLIVGDLVIKIGDLAIVQKTSSEDFIAEIKKHKIGEAITIVYIRGDKTESKTFKLGPVPEEFRQEIQIPLETQFKQWLEEQKKQ